MSVKKILTLFILMVVIGSVAPDAISKGTMNHPEIIIKEMIMADYEKAIKVVLKHEGGYTEDHAGATNFGVTLRSLDVDIDLDGDIDADDIRAMDVADAISFYKRRWWDQYGYQQIGDDDVATKVFDLAINMGARQAARLVQRALRACGAKGIKDDGVLGPVSYQAIGSIPPDRLVACIRSEAAGFYRGLTISKPEYSKYLNGWLNRAYNGDA